MMNDLDKLGEHVDRVRTRLCTRLDRWDEQEARRIDRELRAEGKIP